MDEGVVEGGEKMDDTEVVGLSGSTSSWWSEIGSFLFLDFLNFLRGLISKS
jgi:hypothetical protein